MPARSVVLEKLVKYNGETHADITPGEYTQLTGRAGRRGIDVEGHAVVLLAAGAGPAGGGRAWPRGVRTRCGPRSPRPTTWRSTWSAASAGTAPGRCWSSRSPSSSPTARWSGWPGRWPATREAIAELLGQGEPASAATSRRTPGCAPRSPPWRPRRPGSGGRTAGPRPCRSCSSLKPGDIVRVPGGRSQGWAVVIDPGTRNENETPAAAGADRGPARPPAVAGRLPRRRRRWPAGCGSASTSTPRRPASAATWRPRSAPSWPRSTSDPPRPGGPVSGRGLAGRDRRPAGPSCASTPATTAPTGRPTPAGPNRRCGWSGRAPGCRHGWTPRTNTIANHFDKICTVLESLGYLTGPVAGGSAERVGCWPGSTPSSTWWPPSASAPGCSTS